MTLLSLIGFTLAGYSVIANDSVQTLGTWIASNREKFKWYVLWLAASSVMAFTLIYGWNVYDGDISFGRLDKIPFQEVQWYHALAPLGISCPNKKRYSRVYIIFGIIGFCVNICIREDVNEKYCRVWSGRCGGVRMYGFLISGVFNEDNDIKESNKKYWRTGQWLTTSFLWFTWLSHDIANIAVFLPRQLSVVELSGVITFFTIGLGWIFYQQGGKIQQIVLDKQNTKYVRSATLIDLVYAFLLLYFKQLNNSPYVNYMGICWIVVW